MSDLFDYGDEEEEEGLSVTTDGMFASEGTLSCGPGRCLSISLMLCAYLMDAVC